MWRIKRNDFLVAFMVAILLSLFVNFSLLMRLYEHLGRGGVVSLNSTENYYLLYFSLGWFFLFSLLLYLINTWLYKISSRINIHGEFKAFALATGG